MWLVQTRTSRRACQGCRHSGTGDTSRMNHQLQLQLSYRTEMKSMCVNHQFVLVQPWQKGCVPYQDGPSLVVWRSPCLAFWTKWWSKSALRQDSDVLLKERGWFCFGWGWRLLFCLFFGGIVFCLAGFFLIRKSNQVGFVNLCPALQSGQHMRLGMVLRFWTAGK